MAARAASRSGSATAWKPPTTTSTGPSPGRARVERLRARARPSRPRGPAVPSAARSLGRRTVAPRQQAVRRHPGDVLVERRRLAVGLEQQLPEVLVVAAAQLLGERARAPGCARSAARRAATSPGGTARRRRRSLLGQLEVAERDRHAAPHGPAGAPPARGSSRRTGSSRRARSAGSLPRAGRGAPRRRSPAGSSRLRVVTAAAISGVKLRGPSIRTARRDGARSNAASHGAARTPGCGAAPGRRRARRSTRPRREVPRTLGAGRQRALRGQRSARLGSDITRLPAPVALGARLHHHVEVVLAASRRRRGCPSARCRSAAGRRARRRPCRRRSSARRARPRSRPRPPRPELITAVGFSTATPSAVTPSRRSWKAVTSRSTTSGVEPGVDLGPARAGRPVCSGISRGSSVAVARSAAPSRS